MDRIRAQKIILIIFLIVLINNFGQTVFSQPLSPNSWEQITLNLNKDQIPVTLEQAMRTSLDKNYDIQIGMSQKNQDKWLYYNNLSKFLPDITYNYTQARIGGQFLFGGLVPVTTTTTYIDTGFTAQWFAFTGLSRLFETKASKSLYDASKFRLNLTKEEVLLFTAREYYNLLEDKLNIQIQKVALEQNQAQLKLNQQRFNAGVGTKFDVIRAESEVASAKQNLLTAVNSLKLAQARLANTLGIDVSTPLMPVEDIVIPKSLIKGSLDLPTFTKIALENKPELDIAKLNISAAKSTKNAAFSAYLPSVAVQSQVLGSGKTIDSLGRNQSISLIVNWQGGNGLGLTPFTSIKALNEQVNEAKLNLITTKRNIEEILLDSYYNSMTADQLIEASQAQVDSAEESLRLSMVRLGAGVGIYTDVIAAQLTETQAKTNNLNAIINYNLSQIQLLYDMGVISIDNILTGYKPENSEFNK